MMRTRTPSIAIAIARPQPLHRHWQVIVGLSARPMRQPQRGQKTEPVSGRLLSATRETSARKRGNAYSPA